MAFDDVEARVSAVGAQAIADALGVPMGTGDGTSVRSANLDDPAQPGPAPKTYTALMKEAELLQLSSLTDLAAELDDILKIRIGGERRELTEAAMPAEDMPALAQVVGLQHAVLTRILDVKARVRRLHEI